MFSASQSQHLVNGLKTASLGNTEPTPSELPTWKSLYVGLKANVTYTDTILEYHPIVLCFVISPKQAALFSRLPAARPRHRRSCLCSSGVRGTEIRCTAETC